LASATHAGLACRVGANFRVDRSCQKTGSRRWKLWEVAHKCHCTIIGTCFDVLELWVMMAKVMALPRDTSDFVLLSTAVGNCHNPSRLAEVLHKHLEKRYAETIRQFSNTRDVAGLREHLRAACREGTGIAGALWATWTTLPAAARSNARSTATSYDPASAGRNRTGRSARIESPAQRKCGPIEKHRRNPQPADPPARRKRWRAADAGARHHRPPRRSRRKGCPHRRTQRPGRPATPDAAAHEGQTGARPPRQR